VNLVNPFRGGNLNLFCSTEGSCQVSSWWMVNGIDQMSNPIFGTAIHPYCSMKSPSEGEDDSRRHYGWIDLTDYLLAS
jgi:hypothetical protein